MENSIKKFVFTKFGLILFSFFTLVNDKIDNLYSLSRVSSIESNNIIIPESSNFDTITDDIKSSVHISVESLEIIEKSFS